MSDLVFDTNGNERQKICASYWLDDYTSEIVYGGSKGSGKSFLGVSLIFGDALIYPETHYFIARAELTDLRKFTIPSIAEVLRIWNIPQAQYKYNGQDNFYQLDNGSRVYLLAAKYLPGDPLYERFGSMQMTRGWIEEAGQVDEAAKNNLGASIGRWKNKDYNLKPKLLMTCNPTKNFLYRKFYKPHKEGELDVHKAFVQALPTDNKMLPKGYVENLMKILDVNQKKRLIFGDWEYDDDPRALISYDAILDYFNPVHLESSDDTSTRVNRFITADIARKGKDKTIARVWDGLLCIDRRELKVSLVTESADMIKELSKEYKVPMSKVIVDEDGVGGGVVDILGCKGFINNSRPLNQENYEHLKAQCTFRAAELIEQRQMGERSRSAESKERLIEEMEQVKQADLDADGKRKIVKKDEVKALIGRSPDEWDTIMMRAYFYIKYNDNVGSYKRKII